MNAQPIVIEQVYNMPIQKVWEAITDTQKMKEWYFDMPDFKPEVGNKFSFNGGAEDRLYVHLCEVIEVIPLNKLKHSWRYEGYEGNSFVTWELFSEGEKTRVKLTHEGLETFPASNKDFAKANFVQGWIEITGKMLPEFLERN